MHRTRFLRRQLLGLAMLGLVACNSASTPNASSGNTNLEALIKAAQAEGTVIVMPLVPTWCNYQKIFDTFEAKYQVKIVDRDPDAGSGDAVNAIKENTANTPDVIEVGFSFGLQLTQEKLTQPYQVSTWDTIPAYLKDNSGYWVGGYYGVLGFEVNTALVKNIPQDWPDLLKPEYAGQVMLAGDPTVSSQAIMAIYAATIANGGSYDDVTPGLKFFKELYTQGNLQPIIARTTLIEQGQAPIVLRWDYNAYGDQKAFNGSPPITVVIPKSGVIAGAYVHGINVNAHHPNAAKLWLEFLFSDEGQLLWLEAGCRPARYDDLAARKLIPAELIAALPPAEAYANAIFPSVDQINLAKRAISENWPEIVGVNVVDAPPTPTP